MYNVKLEEVKIPKLKEIKSYKSTYYMAGDDNNFFNHLIYLYENSGIHNSFINNFVQKTIGSGLKSDLEIDNENIYNFKLNDLFKRIVLDYAIYGGFSIEIIWNTLHTKILKLNYVDFSRVRSGMIDEDTDEVEFYYYSYDWLAYHKKYDIYQKFNPEQNTENRQLFYFKGDHPGTDIYPRPLYYGSLKYIYTDIELAKFYANLVKNNFVSNTIIKIPTGMDPDKQIEFEKGIKKNFTSSENAGSIVVIYGDGENSVELHEFGKGSDDQKYQWLTKHTMDELVIAHRIPNPIIAGIRVAGSLGATEEMKNAEMIYNKNVIYPARNMILEQFEKLNNYLINPIQNTKVEDINIFDTKIEEDNI